MRPAKIHFITGLRRDFGGKPFILAHALADGAEIARCDADHRELRRVLAADADSVVLERTFVSSQLPASWTVWPTDRARRWLGRLTGPVDPAEPADRAAA